jgi:Na+:H+ antiporter, NhaA family
LWSFLTRSNFCEIEVSEFFNSHSPYHRQSQNDIGCDNPCSRHLSGNTPLSDFIALIGRQLLRGTDSIAERLERSVHPWVCYLVLPLFALASAGVNLSFEQLKQALSNPIALGIFLGLVVGKAVGITAFSFLAVQSKMAGIADDLTWAGIAGIAMLAGVGFTVALFISGLSFGDETLVAPAKVAVLAASLAAGAIGYLYLHFSLKDNSVQS